MLISLAIIYGYNTHVVLFFTMPFPLCWYGGGAFTQINHLSTELTLVGRQGSEKAMALK